MSQVDRPLAKFANLAKVVAIEVTLDGPGVDRQKVEDSYGQVSEQPSQYNYHWADGFGNFAHSNDPDYDPNRYTTGAAYQRMTPAQ